ncbi:MAG: hypothetical protein KDA57_21810, partial [Planctomycetales bacterium]|nr:hypothetical protein [Planctomycetales bacterium]
SEFASGEEIVPGFGGEAPLPAAPGWWSFGHLPAPLSAENPIAVELIGLVGCGRIIEWKFLGAWCLRPAPLHNKRFHLTTLSRHAACWRNPRAATGYAGRAAGEAQR